jgi:hypothetical protein
MNLQKTRSFLHFCVILLSVLTGTFIIAPALNINIKFGMFIGGILSFALNGILFPEYRQELSVQPNEKNFEFTSNKSKYDFYDSLVHTTNIPIYTSMILFILTFILVLLLDKFNLQGSSEILQIGVPGMAFLWGLSGFRMVIQKETIDIHGRKFKGFWAILNGLVFIVMGWGAIIGIVLGTIFNW